MSVRATLLIATLQSPSVPPTLALALGPLSVPLKLVHKPLEIVLKPRTFTLLQKALGNLRGPWLADSIKLPCLRRCRSCQCTFQRH